VSAPTLAAELFGARLELTRHYAEILGTAAVTEGLIGPRERDRLWDRHLINCALVTELLPPDAQVIDVGSGAGLPGLVLACRRADLRVVLVEPMQRRVGFLDRCVEALELGDQVQVIRGRADDRPVLTALAGAQWVTARAVAPIDRLAMWCLPLLAKDGRLLALKGERARTELDEHGPALRRLGAVVEGVVELGVGRVADPTTVVVVRRQ
jgi:16S rRNA (guanine527-N7)-methyltransferase